MTDEKKTGTMADQIASLKKQRKALHDSLANHVDQETGIPTASSHFASSIASQISQINQTIEILDNLIDDGSQNMAVDRYSK